VVALLGAAVIAVPVFRRVGLGSVLGYLTAGLVIGPFGLALFAEPEAILHVAELGVVMFLFVIGLEMRPSHLWGMRRDIFGLGTLQILACSAALTGVGLAFGFSLTVALIAAWGFVLTSTAIVMQLLAERGDIALPRGQKIVAILLFEDLLIVPLLAIVSLMAPGGGDAEAGSRLLDVAIAIGSLVGLIAAGIWLLDPLFRLLALAKAREVQTAAALLVVLGAALVMQLGGLSMAMGAFLAGVLLSESTFRHQLEADIEPFRGILMGLFFLGVGMSLDLAVVGANWDNILLGVIVMMAVKAAGVYGIARWMGAGRADAIDRAVLMAQGGEFAFVLFAAAAKAGVIAAEVNANLTAIVVLSMALTPIAVLVMKLFRPRVAPSLDGIDVAEGLSGSVLVIGFGRFGQVASQALLARGVDVTIIDNNIAMIRNAERFGFKIYYGDGARLDVLHASGAHSARAIAVCVDDRQAATRIAELAHHEFPQATLLVRAFDRVHAIELARIGVSYQVRETFESALEFGEAALRAVGVEHDEARTIAADIRRRDAARFEAQLAEGISAGRDMLHSNLPKPQPLIPPRQEARVIGGDLAAADVPPADAPPADTTPLGEPAEPAEPA
jgi:glutathione-regulated potassium-efflux system protein KefB